MEKMILIVYENNHYIAPYKKNRFFLIYNFISTKLFQFLFPFRGRRRLLLFNSVLFAQEIVKELMLL